MARSVRATFYLYTSRLRASRVTPTAVDGAFSAGLHEYVSRLHVEQTNQTVQNAPVGTFLGSHLFRAPPRLRGRHIRHWRPEGSQRNQRRVIDGVLTPS